MLHSVFIYLCYISSPLKLLRYDGIGCNSWKVCHQSLVGLDWSMVSQISLFEVPLLLVKLSWSVRRPSSRFRLWLTYEMEASTHVRFYSKYSKLTVIQ